MPDGALTLADGRRLAWSVYGDPAGVPVIAVHGSPDSRVVWRLADDAARSVGVRLVAPDRPGFGDSTPQPGRTIVDWVPDLDALVAHLRLDRYRLLAISGGSPYALAVAQARPEQIAHVGLLSVICPLDVPGVTRDANRQVRFTFWVARHAPRLLGPLARAMVRTAARNPDAAARRLVATRPPADREIIERPDVMAVLMDNLPNQFRDAASIALEMANAARPWGFALADIPVPATIWQGGRDDVHTPAMGRYLADHLPNATLVYEPDHATFTFLDDVAAILTTLTAPAGEPREQ
jgi:pimeloyl-ACP methyl ester carboxylesterase